MKLFSLTALAAIGWAAIATAETPAFGPLVTPAELNTALAGADAPTVLDIREAAAYGQGHIPGAISAPYALFRGPAENPGQLVPEDVLQDRFRALGLKKDHPLVVVHQGKDDSDFGAAARVYWTLKSSGISPLAILNGGQGAWAAEGLPLETRANTPTPSDIEITFSHRWLADAQDVAAIVDGKQSARLIDARPPAFFNGDQAHPQMTRPGTLPGAENVSHSVWFDGPTTVTTAAGAEAVLQKLGLKQDEEIVAFCNTGHWAATDWFALSELAGLPDVKLYPDSMVGWSQGGGAMENTPGLLQNLMNQIRSK